MLTTLFMMVYGDYPAMHKRALLPLLQQDPEKVSVRLWLNTACLDTFDWLLTELPANWLVYVSDQNVPKYQAMRQLFNDPYNPIMTPWVTWLDDDISIAEDDWLEQVEAFIASDASICYFGAQYWKTHLAGVEGWIRGAKWYTGRPFMVAGAHQSRKKRGKKGIAFIRGSYWWLKTAVLRMLDWPDTRLRHNGGDTALAEAVWQARLQQHTFVYGTNKEFAPRRGRSENPAGFKHKYVNKTDGRVPGMIGRMQEYKDRLSQASVPFVSLNTSVLLLGEPQTCIEAGWPELIVAEPVKPTANKQPRRAAVRRRVPAKAKKPVVQHKERPIYVPRAAPTKTPRERLLLRLKRKRAQQVDVGRRDGYTRRKDSRAQQ